MNTLDYLARNTRVVADTGLFKLIQKYQPCDSTTNPSLILAAVKDKDYAGFITESMEYAKKNSQSGSETDIVDLAMIRILYLFGNEILKIIKGRVSIEVDARLSFSIEKQVDRALRIVEMFKSEGFEKPEERILIKLSSTWEGIQAARILESKHGIHCNLTLMFSMAQAIASAEAKVTLISPFVGRILDWFKHANPGKTFEESDPGVSFVRRVYNYYKKYGYKTEVMGASFRNVDEILSLNGCDLLTISPALMDTLMGMSVVPEVKLDADKAVGECVDVKREKEMSAEEFRWGLNEDRMATEKLSDGIRLFAKDARTLEEMLSKEM